MVGIFLTGVGSFLGLIDRFDDVRRLPVLPGVLTVACLAFGWLLEKDAIERRGDRVLRFAGFGVLAPVASARLGFAALTPISVLFGLTVYRLGLGAMTPPQSSPCSARSCRGRRRQRGPGRRDVADGVRLPRLPRPASGPAPASSSSRATSRVSDVPVGAADAAWRRAAAAPASSRPPTSREVLRGLPADRRPARAGRAARRSTTRPCVRLADDVALVQTVDFFTPVVDDPVRLRPHRRDQRDLRRVRDGRPAAVRAGRRRLPGDLDHARRRRDPAGRRRVAAATRASRSSAATPFADPEPKYGLVVTGTVHPDAIWTNAGGQPGDVLVLTKALGTGVVANALRHDAAPPDDARRGRRLDDDAQPRRGDGAARASAPHAVTDVTGFGLRRPPARAGAGVRLRGAPAARRRCRCCRARATWPQGGHVPGGSRRNRRRPPPTPRRRRT